MAELLTQPTLLHKELADIQITLHSSIQTLQALQDVQHNFVQFSQTYEQMKSFLHSSMLQFEQNQENLSQLTKTFAAQQKQLAASSTELSQKQRALEEDIRSNHENRWKESRQEIIQTQNELFRISQTQQAQVKVFIDESNQKQKELAGELRANHENRWKESRQEIIQTQNELFRISQTQQAQVKAFIDESNQKQKELAEELRSNHENRWNGSRQEMVQFQNDLSRVSKANQGQITDSLIELIQKREEVENFLKNNHANRWSQAEDQLSKLTQVNQSLQQQATEMSDAHTKLYSLWQTSEQKNRRRIRMLTFLTWISCLLAFALLAVILYPYYQNYFIFLLDWQGIRH